MADEYMCKLFTKGQHQRPCKEGCESCIFCGQTGTHLLIAKVLDKINKLQKTAESLLEAKAKP